MKQEIKHTEGPWSIKDQYLYICARRKSGSPVVVAKVLIDGYDQENNSAEEGANARLIAAAPELLEAAETGRKLLEQFLDHETYQKMIGGQIKQIDTAIAKARGQS